MEGLSNRTLEEDCGVRPQPRSEDCHPTRSCRKKGQHRGALVVKRSHRSEGGRRVAGERIGTKCDSVQRRLSSAKGTDQGRHREHKTRVGSSRETSARSGFRCHRDPQRPVRANL